MDNLNIKNSTSYKNLKYHFTKNKNLIIKDFFNTDKNRFNKYSILFKNKILIDFSKNLVNNKTLKLLFKFLNDVILYRKINEIKKNLLSYTLNFYNYKNNYLNNCSLTNNKNLINKIDNISKEIIEKIWLGCTKKPLLNIVNIDSYNYNINLCAIINSLKLYCINNFYLINKLNDFFNKKLIDELNLENTLFIISNTYFNVIEITNFIFFIKKKFFNKINKYKFINSHFIIITSDIKYFLKIGFLEKNILNIKNKITDIYMNNIYFRLAIILIIGIENYKDFIEGTNDMNNHFQYTNFNKNIPIILSLIDFWYINFFKITNKFIIPYNNILYSLCKFYKHLTISNNDFNKKLYYELNETILSEIDIQNNFYKLFNNNNIMLCDFICSCKENNSTSNNINSNIDISNILSKSEFLSFGNSNLNKKNIIKASNSIFKYSNIKNNNDDYFIGNIPNNLILLNTINPYNIGSLISLYKNKIFVKNIIFGNSNTNYINSKSIKNLNEVIFNELKSEEQILSHDDSTNNLINFYKTNRN